MNILTIGAGAWVDTSSLGNTFSNLFSEWEDTSFYNLYFRSALPQNNVCDHYFSITDVSIMKNLITPHKIGNRIYKTPNIKNNAVELYEKKTIGFIHRFNIKSVYVVDEWLWKTDKWKNRKLDEFLEEAAPDIIFTFAAGNSNIVRSTLYAKEKTGAKVVSYIVDDVHAQYMSSHSKLGNKLVAQLYTLLDRSDKIYGITREICDKYSAMTGREVTELKKGCRFINPVKSIYGQPIKIVYAGNLLYGRIDALLNLVNVLQRINRVNDMFRLEIYSGTHVSEDVKRKLTIPAVSSFMGERNNNEIIKILSDADILLHIESFLPKEIEKVRYSFSTKIIDCLQSGNVIMAVGPGELSSIKYVKKIPGAIVIDRVEQTFQILREISLNNEELYERALQIRKYAEENHDLDKNRKRLLSDFKQLMGRKEI